VEGWGQAVKAPSQVTPWLSVEEQVVPEQETAGPPAQVAVHTASWETVPCSSGPASSRTTELPQPSRVRLTTAAITMSERFMGTPPTTVERIGRAYPGLLKEFVVPRGVLTGGAPQSGARNFHWLRTRLRHTYGTDVARTSGVEEAKKLLRHKFVSSTQLYCTAVVGTPVDADVLDRFDAAMEQQEQQAAKMQSTVSPCGGNADTVNG
jgi:hypothetical protein